MRAILSPRRERFDVLGIVILSAFSVAGCANRAPKVRVSTEAAATPAVRTGGLRQNQDKIATLNLFYGPGGKEHLPAGKFTFVAEDTEGSSPKFEIVDEQGVHWTAKLGEETKSETAATRLMYAAGYFTDEDYYLPELRVGKMPRLDRGHELVSKGGIVHGVRLERKVTGQKKAGNWSWFKNPFEGTRDLSGLKIMMALMNNWDLKEVNNAIYDQENGKPRYIVSDLGATFGRTGNPLVRSKDNLRDYRRTKFIQKVKSEEVDFYLSSRPFFLTALDVPNYVTRTKMQDVAKHIPRTHARWLGQLLGQLSLEQIRDCFRAGGYSPAEVDGFAKVVQRRIRDLNRL